MSPTPKKRRVGSSSDVIQDDDNVNENDDEIQIPISDRIRQSRSKRNNIQVFDSQLSPERQEIVLARIAERDARPDPTPSPNPWKKPHNFGTSKQLRLEICRRVVKKSNEGVKTMVDFCNNLDYYQDLLPEDKRDVKLNSLTVGGCLKNLIQLRIHLEGLKVLMKKSKISC